MMPHFIFHDVDFINEQRNRATILALCNAQGQTKELILLVVHTLTNKPLSSSKEFFIALQIYPSLHTLLLADVLNLFDDWKKVFYYSK